MWQPYVVRIGITGQRDSVTRGWRDSNNIVLIVIIKIRWMHSESRHTLKREEGRQKHRHWKTKNRHTEKDTNKETETDRQKKRQRDRDLTQREREREHHCWQKCHISPSAVLRGERGGKGWKRNADKCQTTGDRKWTECRATAEGRACRCNLW